MTAILVSVPLQPPPGSCLPHEIAIRTSLLPSWEPSLLPTLPDSLDWGGKTHSAPILLIALSHCPISSASCLSLHHLLYPFPSSFRLSLCSVHFFTSSPLLHLFPNITRSRRPTSASSSTSLRPDRLHPIHSCRCANLSFSFDCHPLKPPASSTPTQLFSTFSLSPRATAVATTGLTLAISLATVATEL